MILNRIFSKRLPPYFLVHRRWLIPGLVAFSTLACVSNTPVAQVATARPTRTPLPTFTHTPIPPTPLPTPTFTHTPIPTDTPTFTPTLPPPTNTPLPTDTPAPTSPPPPPPPTNTPLPAPPPPSPTPMPAPPPAPVNTSPVATPTNTPEPATPPGNYEVGGTQQKNDCANVGVIGKVKDKKSDQPIQFVTIEVKSDDDDYRGPFIGKTGENGKYTILIGPLKDNLDGVKFKATITGAGVEVDDDDNEAEWIVDIDCQNEDSIQVYEINWEKK